MGGGDSSQKPSVGENTISLANNVTLGTSWQKYINYPNMFDTKCQIGNSDLSLDTFQVLPEFPDPLAVGAVEFTGHL